MYAPKLRYESSVNRGIKALETEVLYITVERGVIDAETRRAGEEYVRKEGRKEGRKN